MKLVITSWFIALLVSMSDGVADEPATTVAPQWIWAEEANDARSAVTLSRTFLCPAEFTEARLRLAADFASCRVVLNGHTVAALDEFGPQLDLDVTNHLRPGKNAVDLQASRTSGPAAIAASLQITVNRAVSQSIVTDSSWNVSAADGEVSNPESSTVSLGTLAPQFWIDPRTSRITAFDDYAQWKLDQRSETDAASPDIFTLPGFEVELLRKATPKEGSWVSMAFDPQGRLTIAREDKGLLRATFTNTGEVESIETIDDTLLECRGLLYAFGDLYANANNSKGLYRLHDSAGDDQFDEIDLLREFPGGVGHGRNDLALGPDGLIYSIHGDSVDVPGSEIADRTSPFRDGGLDKPQQQGHLIRTDQDGQHWELVSTGLRNPFGIDFNEDDEAFTYDADAEFDMGAPWYRPTRLNHLVSGADFGWRALTKQWPPYELDHADNALSTANIGKGSPTAVKFGHAGNFPSIWQDALFILDWAYGRIVACHLYPRGAGYRCTTEIFLKGRPLNLTDLDFGPDGAMYLITGGRKTESSLYRVRWIGQAHAQSATQHQQARDTFSDEQRKLRRHLEQWHRRSDDDGVIDQIWGCLASADPAVRSAARNALEHQPVDHWRNRVLSETVPTVAASALLSLARGTTAAESAQILTALTRLRTEGFSVYDDLTVLQAYGLCLTDTALIDEAVLGQTHHLLTDWLTDEVGTEFQRIGPVGSGHNVEATLSRLIMQIDDSDANRDIVNLLRRSTRQEDRMLYLFLLRNATTGWKADDRVLYLDTLNDLQQNAVGGDGMPGFLQQIREAAVASLSSDERGRVENLIEQPGQSVAAATITRPHVRDWTAADIDQLVAAAESLQTDRIRGQELFASALCYRCHRVRHNGGVLGPDLTAIGNRFSRRDILKSILEPSDVVAERYRNVQVVTKGGQTVIGQVVASGDYRSAMLRIATDPLAPAKTTEIAKNEVEVHRLLDLSPMPKGLLSTLTAEEIGDLLEYLVSASTTRQKD